MVKNIFDPKQKDLFVTAIKFDFNKTPLCTAHWGNSEMIIYKEDFENYWLSRKSYSKVDKRKGIVSGIIIFILFVFGIFYFYTKFPFSAEFYFNKGKTEYVEKSDNKNALIHLSKAIELNPKYTEAYFERGLIKFNSKDYNGSIQDLDKAIEIKPSDSAFVFRAMVKYFSGDFKGVIEDCDKAIAFNSSKDILAGAYNFSGQAKANLKDNDGALKDFSKAIELNPSFAKSYNNKAVLEGNLNNHESAIKDYNKAIELDTTWAEAYANRGLEKNYTEDYLGALEDFNKAIKLKPDDAITFAGRGFTKDNLKD